MARKTAENAAVWILVTVGTLVVGRYGHIGGIVGLIIVMFGVQLEKIFKL